MICRKCGLDKVAGDFNWTSSGYVLNGQRCRACVKLERTGPKYTSKQRDYHLKRFYNITQEQYNLLLNEQEGKCAICGSSKSKRKDRNFFVDHNHKTNEIRGLLCNNCNSALGLLGLENEPDRIFKLISYLQKYNLLTKVPV